MNKRSHLVAALLLFAIAGIVSTSICRGAAPPEVRDVDSRLLEGLDDLSPLRVGPKTIESGEDIGVAKPQSTLESLARMMQSVEQRIKKLDTSNTTQQVQKEIASQLARLIEASEQSETSQATSTESDQIKQQEVSEGDKEANGDPKSKHGGAADKSPDALQAVWGTLPERLRQQLQSPSSEDFLPRYEEIIKQYYKRVAEHQRRLRD